MGAERNLIDYMKTVPEGTVFYDGKKELVFKGITSHGGFHFTEEVNGREVELSISPAKVLEMEVDE